MSDIHCMIDLETLAVDPNAFIISIGAVSFDKGGIIDTFYRSIDMSHNNFQFTINPVTVSWWLDRSDAARKAIRQSVVGLPKALGAFTQFYLDNNCIDVWGNGATFDNVILRNAYEKCNLQCPWKFTVDRCYRTICSMYPDVKLVRIGEHHNALDDAISQAEHLIKLKVL